MDLKKLYGELTVLCGSEIPIYTFLTYLDMGVRDFLCRYPKKLIMPHGEYVTPESLSDGLALDDSFSLALVLYILGNLSGNAETVKKSDVAAEKAYISLWKAAAKGKRLAGVNW